jgi:Xaa-Pro dipeptidase
MVNDSSQYTQRQARLGAILQRDQFDGLVLNPGPGLTYLTGLHIHLSERPVIAIYRPNLPLILVLPELEAGKTTTLPFSVQTFPYGEDPSTWDFVFQQAFQAAGLTKSTLGIEPRYLRLLEYRFLEDAASEAKFGSAERSLSELRSRKDETEINSMRKAVDIAQNALQETLPKIKAGITEREVASELVVQLLKLGSDPKLPFFPIVASGPNSANPHANPTDRPLQNGDLLIIDWGANVGGYYSDITRTFTIGEIDPALISIGEVVLDANSSAREVTKPDTSASDVDKAARSVIEDAGYGEYFIHRTGHGLGLEAHEDPYIRAENPQLLQEGMTFTIEPGIYLPGRGGIRIEDDVFVTPEGAEVLTDLPRELTPLG